MKNIWLIIFGLLFLLGCTRKNELIGSWILKDDFQHPIIINFSEDQYFEINSLYEDTFSYSFSKNKIYFQNNTAYPKSFDVKYKLSENLLYYIHDNSDSISFVFERLNSSCYLNHLFEKKGIKIDLPEGNGNKIRLSNLTNLNYLGYDSIGQLTYWYNGIPHALDSNLYNLFLNYSTPEREMGLINNLLLIDKDVEYKFLQELKWEFRKASQLKVTYVTNSNNESNNPLGYSFKLPPLNESDRDLYPIGIALPPAPPPPLFSNTDKIIKHVSLVELYTDRILINNTNVNLTKLREIIENNIVNDSKYISPYYIAPDVKYSRYIDLLVIFKESILTVRNQYATETFGILYDNLNSEKQKIVRRKYPMSFAEINMNQLEYTKDSILKYNN